MYIDLATDLQPNISWWELTTTNHRKYLARNRIVPKAFEPAGRDLAQLLQFVRSNYDRPLIIHSGYRCEDLNTVIGGSNNSQHTKFEASDFRIVGVDLTKVWEWIWQDSGLAFGQLILEGWSVGRPSWIHMSLGAPYRSPDKCGQVMTFEAGKYKTIAKVKRGE